MAAATLSLAAWQDRPRPESQTFRVTTERIQFDALFLDSQHRPVTDIRPDEVTVRQAGTVVQLTDVRYYPHAGAPTPSGPRRESPPSASPDSTASNRTTAAATDGAAAWVFLIDDLAMSPDGFARAKTGLLSILNQEFPAGVAMGVLRTGVIGTHRTRLSDDRQELRRSVSAMRYKNQRWRGGIMSRSGATLPGPTNDRDRVYLEGTLGSLNSLLVSLRPLSGRKVVVVLSELIALTAVETDVDPGGGIQTVVWDVKYNGTAARLERLGRLASDAGVTVHTVDLSAVTAASSNDRALQDEGLHAVADELGGLYFGRSNHILPLFEKVVGVEQGHYVLAYEPPAGTFDDGGKPRFVDVEVRVMRPGVTVRTRKGFFTR